MGAMVPPSRKSCYNFRVVSIDRVVDGDTIDVSIDLGFDLIKKERVRVAGVDTPEKRTRDLEEKALGLDATDWMKKNLEESYHKISLMKRLLQRLKMRATKLKNYTKVGNMPNLSD